MAKQREKLVLILSTANLRRGRFAEILFNSVVRKMGLAWRATSRGLSVTAADPMDANAIKALQAIGVSDPIAIARKTQSVTLEELSTADRVIALNRAEHLPLIEQLSPDAVSKVECWNIVEGAESFSQIEKEVNGLVARLLGGGNRPEPIPEPSREPAKPTPPKKNLTAKVGRETSGRRGKGVTTIFDLKLNEEGMRDLAALLKQKCGTGGTVKDGRIEIQGDQRERIVAELEKLGYTVKRAGG